MSVSAASKVKVRRMVDHIQKTYSARTTLQTVSTAVREKSSLVGPLFRTMAGMSVHSYVTQVRLRRAAHLIRSGMKVEAVAANVGYASKKNFYRQFIRHYGATPEAFRKRRENARGWDRRAVPDRDFSEEVVTHAAATCDQTACVINVEKRPNVKGLASFVATPFVLLAHGIQPFAATSAHVEISGESEREALARVAVFLEHRFGECTLKPAADRQNGLLRPLLPARP
jgi:AraC-like DNA-binding protein